MFNSRHALPRFFNRFSLPPIIRRLSGDIADEFPTDIRPEVCRNAGGMAISYPATQPLIFPGSVPALAGKVPGNLRTVVRQISRSLLLQCRRMSDAIGPEFSGHFLIRFPTYARH